MALSAAERETVINATDDGADVSIWTAQRRFINRLRKHPSFTEVASGFHDGSEWASFTIPFDQWNPASGAKRQSTMTAEQKAAGAARLAAARANR
jgi:hypothetical protein